MTLPTMNMNSRLFSHCRRQMFVKSDHEQRNLASDEETRERDMLVSS
jgi:hypothetical protein